MFHRWCSIRQWDWYRRGCSAAVLLALEQDSDRIELCELSSSLVDSVKAEVTAVALALESLVSHFNSTLCRKTEEHLIVITDCKPAISIVTQRSQMNDYSEVFTHLRLSLQMLNDVCMHIRGLDSWLWYSSVGSLVSKFRIFTSNNRGGKCDCPQCLFVCLLADYSKTCWVWSSQECWMWPDDKYHYFFTCPKHIGIRDELLESVKEILAKCDGSESLWLTTC